MNIFIRNRFGRAILIGKKIAFFGIAFITFPSFIQSLSAQTESGIPEDSVKSGYFSESIDVKNSVMPSWILELATTGNGFNIGQFEQGVSKIFASPLTHLMSIQEVGKQAGQTTACKPGKNVIQDNLHDINYGECILSGILGGITAFFIFWALVGKEYLQFRGLSKRKPDYL